MYRFENFLVVIVALLLAACGREDGGTVTGGIMLEWTPPSEYADGGALASGELTEYKVYVDRRVVATVVPPLTEYYLELPTGEWDVTLSVVAGGVESVLSEPVHVTIPAEH